MNSSGMAPEEFMEIWGVTKEELAIITSKSSETIKNWFAEGSKHRPPTQDVLDRLAFVHLLWSQWLEEERVLPPNIRSVFEIVKNRKKLGNSYLIIE